MVTVIPAIYLHNHGKEAHKMHPNILQRAHQLLDYRETFAIALPLSYNELPSHLKAHFLYFGIFPISSEISVKKLIRLWIAGGLIELKGQNEFENEAASLLQQLIDDCLVVVSKQSLNGKIKTCRVHESKNLLYVANPEMGKTYRCFLLKVVGGVLNLESLVLSDIPTPLLNLVFLRYVAVALTIMISKCLEISSLWDLRTFIVLRSTLVQSPTISLSHEIWEMPQLRHLHSARLYLSSPMKVSANEG
ncbi:hypothetical protein HAX54_038503 [Datura stramonium]|uniref:Disease resistance protein winged helix domain-containing protein n=1 Tax=Datura stramonium TaxID=4076 RepID=A0ABS8SHY5_DATST|nr:hypothetical protein [Datura stramonium]